MWRTSKGAVGVLAVAVLVVAGCGGDSGDDESAPATSADPPPELTGEELHVWVIEDSSESAGITFPTVRAGLEARVDRINREGGLGGSQQPVVLEYCVTDFDANAAAQCARDAVADPATIAVAGSVSANGDATLPILEEAGVANVGSTAFSVADSTSPVSFPVMSGLIAATGCGATLLRDEADVTSFGVARTDAVGADQTGALLTALGLPPEAEVVTPAANPDYSAELSALASQVDGILLAQDAATAEKSVRNLGQIGNELPIVGSGAQAWTAETLQDLGDAAEGMYLALWFATDDSGAPGIESYLSDLEAIGASDQSDDLAKMGWTSMELLDQLAAEASTGTIDRASVLADLGATSAFDSGGVTPVIDFTTPGPLLGGASPRFVNDSCVYAQVIDGRIQALGDFVTPFSG